jgi:GT2 family glycosyltransferase
VEVILVDDGSTDGTPAVAAALAGDPRVSCLRQANQGRSLARNAGARVARGAWLGFLDSDDRYLPDTLSGYGRAMDRHPSAGMLLGGYEYVDATGQRLGERRPWEEGPLTLKGWLFNCLGMPGSVVVQRTWFERMGGFDRACEIAEDWDLFLRLAHAGCGMAWVEAPVCQYRQHADNSTHAIETHRRGSLRALDKLLSQPSLPPEAAAAGPRARAWVWAVFARRALLAGDDARGREYAAEAVRAFPAFAEAEKVGLLELLLTMDGQGEAVAAKGLAARLGPALPISAAELRRAEARAAMAAFFRLRREAPGAARGYLWRGVRRDPRWLANRGVLGFIVRQGLRGAQN